MATYVTLEQAKDQLNVTSTDKDALIERKAETACAIILDYLKDQGDPTWDETTVPGQVSEATLLLITHLYEHRGDDMKADLDTWQAIERLLMRSRDPALA